MNIFFSGIGGAGLAPLAMLAQDSGYSVSGYDAYSGLQIEMLNERGITSHISVSPMDLEVIHKQDPIDWIIITSALPEDHPHIIWAQENGVRYSKRHELINHITNKHNLKLIAIAGTHGKTTTTAMLVWIFNQYKIPVSYLIGSNITFGPAAQYVKDSRYFVYEADEFDRNFLEFEPYLSIIPSLEFDHPDTYTDLEDYQDAFVQFLNSSDEIAIMPQYVLEMLQGKELTTDIQAIAATGADEIDIPGEYHRMNAALACNAMQALHIRHRMFKEEVNLYTSFGYAGTFPGTQRRFESIQTRLFSDYAHHPSEIKATILLAQDWIKSEGFDTNIIIVYQPHQNIRQFDESIRKGYQSCFNQASQIYWLPTYLSREDTSLRILSPTELIPEVVQSKTQISTLSPELKRNIQEHLNSGATVICMGAGSIDGWLRENFG